MKSLNLALLTFFAAPLIASAAILPTKAILQKTTDNAGAGLYAIEQEVQFSNGDDTITVKETWLIQDDHTMRLTVSGGKELQNSFSLQFIYGGGQKWSLTPSGKKNEKIPEDFLERFFNFRNPDVMAQHLINNKIIPTYATQKRPLARVGTEFKHESENWVRYSRTAGVVNYAFGIPTPVDKELNYPGLWIEQDQFLIRKLRLPSQVEVLANNYSQFSRGLNYPRSRTVRWGNHTATIRLISATARPQSTASQLQPASLDKSAKWDGTLSLAAKEAITEFYTRFR